MKSRGSTTMPALMALLFAVLQVSVGQNALGQEPWQQERPVNLPQIQNLEVMCAKDHMEVQLSFDKPFTGLVFSKGQFGQDNCVYVHPKSSRTNFRFSIIYNGCGTKPDAKGKFYENTVVVQYDEELIEVWDEAKRLRCEWYNDYEKTATKPPMVIADLEVVELNFRGDNVDCWMEIQNGKGPWASPISGIVPLGSTLTMVVAINDLAGEFDMRVKSCEASDGVNRPIQLSDEHGCVLRPKMVSKFLKLRSNDGRSTVMSYAFFHAFKFPDSLQVYIRCKVEICRHGCPEHCDKTISRAVDQQLAYTSETKASYSPAGSAPIAAFSPIPAQQKSAYELPPQPVPVRNSLPPVLPPQGQQYLAQRRTPLPAAPVKEPEVEQPSSKRPFFGLLGRNKASSADRSTRPGLFQKKKDNFSPVASAQVAPPPQAQAQVVDVPIPIPGSRTQDEGLMVSLPSSISIDRPEAKENKKPEDNKYSERGPGKFPHGPRSLNFDKFDIAHIHDLSQYEVRERKEGIKSRSKRSYAIHERHVRSADVGVKVGYEVISAVDLAFSLNSNSTNNDGDMPSVTIFQGKIREEVVYGICLPAPGFSALFVLLAMCVVISVLVASFLCYHRQLQKADHDGPSHPHMSVVGSVVAPSMPFRDWSTVHFIRNPSKSVLETQS